jgi:23S rRNA pseudouridine2605 synthase
MTDPADATGETGERIAKRIARAGAASRREAERLIDAGRVTVNGAVIRSPALDVAESDIIAIDGVTMPKPERTRLWRYHKPAGFLVSRTDPRGRPTIYGELPPELKRAITVGRLDFASEGLLLLTNDGELSRRLELPTEGLVRRYRARAFGHIDQKALDRLAKGITVDGVRYGPIQATLEEARGANAWIGLTLTEGKNREVRNVLRAVGLHVNRLIRTAYGPFQLGDMPPGAVAEVPAASLMRDLGIATERPKGWAKAKPRPAKHRAKQRPGKNARLAQRKPGDDGSRAARPEPRDHRPSNQRPGDHRPGDRRPSGNAHNPAGRAPPRASAERKGGDPRDEARSGTPHGKAARPNAARADAPRRDGHRSAPKPHEPRPGPAREGGKRPRGPSRGANAGPRGPHRGPNADRRR